MNTLNTSQTQQQKIKRLWWVLGLRSGLFLVELGAGLWSHSLSLLAGSGHLFSDLITLGVTLLATWFTQRRTASQTAISQNRRLEAGIALLNGVSLAIVAILLGREAIEHLQSPEPVLGLPLLGAAGLSLIINGLSVYLLHNDHHHDLNLRGVFLHGVADAASSIGVMVAALAVYFFNWVWVDAAIGLLVALLICLSTISLVTDSLRILRHHSV
ncbi:MAG: cation transporter [Leptolyngbya sp. UWPOB_LEPTO1]|uniref:cation diffusion facilitator family transporter n=1 Tax=Leptolyngbya sp. UWPOB_LEPTO1 TaxID=2815653 RepID=UPI001ACE8DB3|nr:cation diffusion facilitator family transporter [Leptolyngbya sp. UWPOB_LEPTO1]MBN8560196.1 cation transporter [Leptolyngbya sp. UWPOB_LEPTO1]